MNLSLILNYFHDKLVTKAISALKMAGGKGKGVEGGGGFGGGGRGEI